MYVFYQDAILQFNTKTDMILPFITIAVKGSTHSLGTLEAFMCTENTMSFILKGFCYNRFCIDVDIHFVWVQLHLESLGKAFAPVSSTKVN